MHHSAYVNAEKFAKKYIPNLEGIKILDVGSYDVNGTMKPIFERAQYVGLDMEAGPNVDVVGVSHDIPFGKDEFDVVISSSCFEHDDMFWISFQEMCRVLKPGGYMYIQAPSNGPYHGWPGDNWRFYIDSWKALEKWSERLGYEIELVEHYIDETTPAPSYEGNRIWNDSIGIYRKKSNKTPNTDLKSTQTFNTDLKSIESGHLNTKYRDITMHKSPFDITIYQMIVNEVKPDLIIEIGTFKGGGALYFADLLNIIGKGEVHTINIIEDVDDLQVINNPRIKRFTEGYQNYDINLARGFEKVLVIDDGSHRSQEVLDAFNKFKSVVTHGSYYIIEDGVLSDLGYDSTYDGGPLKVMGEIIDNNKDFTVDRKWCDFYGKNATFNPNGYLKRTNNNKKVALISSFCDTQEKTDVLEKNIKIVKENGLDVILISPISLPESVIKLCDYFFYTKDNPVLNWPVRGMRAWVNIDIDGVSRRLSRTYPDYGFAGLTQIKQLSEIALNFEYDQFYHMIYDLKIDENVIKGFHSSKDYNLYPSKRNDFVWEVGLHYMIFNRENLKEFISHISLDSYVSLTDTDAFEWLKHMKTIIPFQIEKTPVEDEIYFYEHTDFHDYSPTDKFKLFIEKNDMTLEPIKLLFYNLTEEKEVKIKVGYNVESIHLIRENKIIPLGFNKTNYQSVRIEVDSVEYDLTESIKEIKHNTII
jgi:cephalosporin hydroxylase